MQNYLFFLLFFKCQIFIINDFEIIVYVFFICPIKEHVLSGGYGEKPATVKSLPNLQTHHLPQQQHYEARYNVHFKLVSSLSVKKKLMLTNFVLYFMMICIDIFVPLLCVEHEEFQIIF